MSSSFKVFLRVFLLTTIASLVAVSLILATIVFGFVDSISDLNVESFRLNFTSYIYYIDEETGEPVEYERLYAEENRVWVDIDKMPQELLDAIVSIEDERYYSHAGVDIKSSSKAVFDYVFQVEGGRGASTITQQLVKNLTGDSENKVTRKAQEMLRALNLERKMSKEQILELYLNTIYLSQGCHGVGSASMTYFGRPVSELNLEECALIAGITQYPTRYDPILNFENSKAKQELVLSEMLEQGKITQEQHDSAVAAEIKLNYTKPENLQSYFVDQVIDDVLEDLKKEKGYSEAVALKMLYSGGLRIYATIDPKVQQAMDDVFKNDDNFPKTVGDVAAEASMVVMDPYTGDIKGIVGGRGDKTASRTLNRGSQTLRQPGSTIKPIAVYAPAIEHNLISPATVYTDKAISFGSWAPKNYYSGFRGSMTVRAAIEQSVNTIPVQILQKLGIETSFSFLKNNLGVTSLVEREKRGDVVYSDKTLASLALGGLTDGVSALEMTAAYAAFPNRGIYIKPRSYTKILDSSGRVLHEKRTKTNIAMRESTATLMNNLLRGVVTNGTGTAANFRSDMSICGKTGTTDLDMDRWFVGYTPYYVGTVWFGYDTPKSMRNLFSSNPTIPVWRKVMEQIHKGKSNKSFPVPEGMRLSSYCMDSNCIPNEFCESAGRVRSDYFQPGTVPTKACEVHSGVRVDISTGTLANSYCPSGVVRFVAAAADSETIDYEGMEIARTYCTVHNESNSGTLPEIPTSSPTPTPTPTNTLPVPTLTPPVSENVPPSERQGPSDAGEDDFRSLVESGY